MPVDPPSNVYRDVPLLCITGLHYGVHKTIYNHVSIGNVGYVREGAFIRMFNVIPPWIHESNRKPGESETYESMDCGPFTNTIEVLPLRKQEHHPRHVSVKTLVLGQEILGRALSDKTPLFYTSFSVHQMTIGDWWAVAALVYDDIPYTVLRLSTNESLGTEASAQKVDTPEPLRALNRVRADAGFERPEDLRLPRLTHGLIIITTDSRAKMKVDG